MASTRIAPARPERVAYRLDPREVVGLPLPALGDLDLRGAAAADRRRGRRRLSASTAGTVTLTGTRSRTGAGQPLRRGLPRRAPPGDALGRRRTRQNGENSPQPAGPRRQHRLAQRDAAEACAQRNRDHAASRTGASGHRVGGGHRGGRHGVGWHGVTRPILAGTAWPTSRPTRLPSPPVAAAYVVACTRRRESRGRFRAVRRGVWRRGRRASTSPTSPTTGRSTPAPSASPSTGPRCATRSARTPSTSCTARSTTPGMSPDVGCVLLTGNGPSPQDGGWAFCSGGDQRIRGSDGYQYAERRDAPTRSTRPGPAGCTSSRCSG